ncbi:MarR family winged helix-turn-helix transcriptional regulator [Primorskyibacter sp. S87]|uniref:MarR family winged helix-turn-helix transcriptional regulator n=1 Tax=Primorskyibacter sp. S87 TaxID=3415126 RepID=UPI003C7E1E21
MTPTKRETEIWILLNRAHRLAHREMEAELRDKGLPSLRWYDVLWGIEISGAEGVRAYELTDKLLFEQSNLSRILNQMVERGMIRETVLEKDRRGKTLQITKEGAAMRAKMWKVYGAAIKRKMEPLAAAEDLLAFLEQLQEAGGGPMG